MNFTAWFPQDGDLTPGKVPLLVYEFDDRGNRVRALDGKGNLWQAQRGIWVRADQYNG